MFLIGFSFRRIVRHWRINLLIFSGLVLAGAIVAGLPVYARYIAAQSLVRSLADEPAFSRNILLTAPPSVTSFNAALNQVVVDELGFMVLEQLEVRQQETDAFLAPDGETVPGTRGDPVRVWSLGSISQSTTIAAGRYPNHTLPLTGAAALIEPQPVEAAVGLAAAEAAGLAVGDVLFTEGEFIQFTIVGIIAPLDPDDERWFADLRPFELEIQPGLNEDIIITPLVLNPASVGEYFSNAERSWRLVVDQALLRPDS
jgi:hypothetical protein